MRTYEGLFIKDFQKIATKDVYISVLSVHITCYVHKIKLPDSHLENHLTFFKILPITTAIIQNSLSELTTDYEDNIQINSALSNNIKTFVTFDKELLKMKSYRGMKIVEPSQL